MLPSSPSAGTEVAQEAGRAVKAEAAAAAPLVVGLVAAVEEATAGATVAEAEAMDLAFLAAAATSVAAAAAAWVASGEEVRAS